MTIRERALAIAHKVFGNVPGLLVESLADDIEKLCNEVKQPTQRFYGPCGMRNHAADCNCDGTGGDR